MKKYKITTMGALIILLTAPQFSKPKIAATYDGGQISITELNQYAQKNLAKIKEQKYQALSESLYYLLIEKLLSKEAKSQKTTVAKLKSNFLKMNLPKVSEKEVVKFYHKNKAKLAGSYEAIKFGLKEYMLSQQRNEVIQNLHTILFRKYNVGMKLNKPKPFKLSRKQLLKNTHDDPSWGNPKSKVFLVEFSDFECPYCQKVQPLIKKIRKDFGNKIFYVFRDFPLNFHFQSKVAHMAANCANQQKKYFPFHNKVFQVSPKISAKSLLKIAKQVGLKISDYKKCLKNLARLNEEVNQDIEDGKRLGVDGTPTLFLNGEKINGFEDYEKIKNKIEKLLKNK